MNTIRDQLASIGLARLSAAIRAASRPSVRLTAGTASAQPVSRIGGRPNLPRYVEWPTWNGGQPLAFIAQLDLATIPQVRGLALPRAGSLFFFYDADEQTWGYDPMDRGSAQVIYSPEPLTANGPRTWCPDLDEEVRFRSAAVSAGPNVSIPALDGEIMKAFSVTEAEWQAYWEKFGPMVHPVHRMGGHPDAIQGDLALEAQYVSNGIDCGSPKGYEQGRRRGLDAGAKDWQLLLQVDSEERLGMMWGDLGRLYFMIHKGDLRRRQFDNVWAILQCT